ncbi:MAG: VOC family protein [Gaiellales bacterium]
MKHRPIQGLGEIALRVRDLETMTSFYTDVVGLELMDAGDAYVFFRVADGVAGHTQVVALFGPGREPYGAEGRAGIDPRVEASTLHHLALAISKDDLAAEKERLEALGFQVTSANHKWTQWRSLYVNDPEGNVVEWVCFDPSV